MHRICRPLTVSLVLLIGGLVARADDMAQIFAKPPEAARPWTFWYWMNGSVSKEGVTADLEAMKRIGLGGAYLVPIKDVLNPPLYQPSIRTLTPEWWAMLRYTFSEADRIGLKLGMHVSDGFATAGGPWITPELAMQKVVWSEQQVGGGCLINKKLAQPASYEGFYRDIAVLAFPAPEGADVSTRTVVPKVTTDVVGADAQALAVPGNMKRLRSEKPCWIQYEFAEPFNCRSIVVRPDGANYPALRLIVEVSDDGKAFRSLGRLETPRHGWQDSDAPYTFSIKATTARFFRFVHDPVGAESGAEDLDSAKWRHVFKVQSIELFSEARIPHYEGKSGLVWRRSSRATAELIPNAQCVPQDKIIDLTALLSSDGQLKWDVPAGNWTILRIGYTATGHRNETAGAGRGLECDKFNAAVTRLQFDKWFGETIRQVGPELATRVLKTLHVDSWEAGSQNWSPVFREEFAKRRGYDLTVFLPVFAGIPIQSAEASECFLNDVRQTIVDLTNDGFFLPLAELAKQHGCTFTAEATAPTMMGDGMRHFASVDVPMGEFWLRSPTQDKPNDIQDAISGAHVYGKQIVMAEAFTERNMEWDEHPGMLKALGDHNFTLGINRLLLHVFTHNPWLDRKPGMTLSNIGLFFQRDQTWFEPARAWIDYLTRCQALLQEGRAVADVAYFTGEELPSRALLPERCAPSLPVGYKADSINRDALLRLAVVRNGRIELPGGASYAVLVLPPVQIGFSSELLAKIDELERAGAAVYRHGKKASLEDLLAQQKLTSDFVPTEMSGQPTTAVEWAHRVTNDGDIYFVSNQSASSRELRLSLRAKSGRPDLFDPLTGEITHAPRFAVSGGRTELTVKLAAHGSVFVVLQKNSDVPNAETAELKLLRKVDGPWQVTFSPANGGPAQLINFPQLISWSEHADPAIRFYSGSADYMTHFDWAPAYAEQRVWLELGDVANIAEVKVNGVAVGTFWTPPYQVEITKVVTVGKNTLDVRVTNTWANRLIGDCALPPGKRLTWTTVNSFVETARLLPAGLLGPVKLFTDHSISAAEMQRVYDEVKTPFKYGVILQPDTKDEIYDCPNVFRHDGKWYMMYVAAKNQVGYETCLAVSDDLLNWKKLGKILPFAKTGWDAWQGDGGVALFDHVWGGSAKLQQHDGRYWLTYIGGAKQGYEPDPLAIGMAWTKDPTTAEPWTRLAENPVLHREQSDVRYFEKETLYKSTILKDSAKTLGHEFVMFYNAKQQGAWVENIGMAVSDDMVHWQRFGDGPVVENHDYKGRSAITGDPQVVRMGKLWVMFYFGAGWKKGAFDTFAVSSDLVHWTQWQGPNLVQASEPWDKVFAHKPWLLKHDGVVYHFYCAVSKENGRVIALATSKDLRPNSKSSDTSTPLPNTPKP